MTFTVNYNRVFTFLHNIQVLVLLRLFCQSLKPYALLVTLEAHPQLSTLLARRPQRNS